MRKTFKAYYEEASEWAKETFGPGERDEGVSDHIQKELSEIAEAESEEEKIAEWIDVLILTLDGLVRHGLTYSQIVKLLHKKLQVNKSRSWPDWRTAEAGKAIEHIREVA